MNYVAQCDVETATECDLPSEPPAHDPFLVDEVAVRRAVQGGAVVLTVHEWRVAVRILIAEGHTAAGAARWMQFRRVRVVNELGNSVPTELRTDFDHPVVPTDHVEELIVDLRIAGRNIELTPHELNAAVWRLHDQGRSNKAIAARLRVRHSTVTKALRSRTPQAQPSPSSNRATSSRHWATQLLAVA